MASITHHLFKRQYVFPEINTCQRSVLLSPLVVLASEHVNYQLFLAASLNILGAYQPQLFGFLLEPLQRPLLGFTAWTSPFAVLPCSQVSYLSAVVLPVLQQRFDKAQMQLQLITLSGKGGLTFIASFQHLAIKYFHFLLYHTGPVCPAPFEGFK